MNRSRFNRRKEPGSLDLARNYYYTLELSNKVFVNNLTFLGSFHCVLKEILIESEG
ncbi:MAG: hypothetical protein PVG34_12670 [Desulfobacterales bacterium]